MIPTTSHQDRRFLRKWKGVLFVVARIMGGYSWIWKVLILQSWRSRLHAVAAQSPLARLWYGRLGMKTNRFLRRRGLISVFVVQRLDTEISADVRIESRSQCLPPS
jgi:hypothetical protein